MRKLLYVLCLFPNVVFAQELKPGIVYMHGAVVRENPDRAERAGYDVDALVQSFEKLGYVTIAPIRETPAGTDNGDEAIKEGIELSRKAAKELRSRSDVDPNRICLVGFSEGALISMWALALHDDYNSAVIMSSGAKCGIRKKRGSSKTMCSRHLIRSGKIHDITEPLVFTVGKNEHDGRPARQPQRPSIRFSEETDSPLIWLEGDHRDFIYPRTDIEKIVRKQCR